MLFLFVAPAGFVAVVGEVDDKVSLVSVVAFVDDEVCFVLVVGDIYFHICFRAVFAGEDGLALFSIQK